jgi:2-polyprenyl-6-methoxyphenol hydroxylase-like FAD-dependent oxidoreductase
MAIEDGYFLGKFLEGRDLEEITDVQSALARYDDERVAYTNRVTAFAREMGRSFHGAPWHRRIRRDLMLDYTKIPDRRISDGYQRGAEHLLRSILATEATPSGAPES